ncbi:hypothetical protein LSAT2_018093, partial [Lamellibrachia satsuma]
GGALGRTILQRIDVLRDSLTDPPVGLAQTLSREFLRTQTITRGTRRRNRLHRRPGRPWQFTSVHVTCLSQNATTASIDHNSLAAVGLGIPQNERCETRRRKTRFSFAMTNRDVREKIKELFPRVIGFELARRTGRAKLEILPLDIIPAQFKADNQLQEEIITRDSTADSEDNAAEAADSQFHEENVAASTADFEDNASDTASEMEEEHYVDAGTPTVQIRAAGTGSFLDGETGGIFKPVLPTETLEAGVSKALADLSQTISSEIIVAIQRHDVVMALLNLYRQEDTTACRLSVQFLGEEGDDFGGLTKEMFTIFWRSVAEELLCGEHRVVPRLPLHRERKEAWKYVSLGRILSHTVALTETLPVMLSTSMLLNVIFETDVAEECLLEDFLL